MSCIDFIKPGKKHKKEKEVRQLKYAGEIRWHFPNHIMEASGGLLKRSSLGRKRLWWRRWVYTLGCTCQMGHNWQHRGLSRLRRWNSSGDLQSRPETGSNKNRHKKERVQFEDRVVTSRTLPLTQPLLYSFYLARDLLGGKHNTLYSGHFCENYHLW